MVKTLGESRGQGSLWWMWAKPGMWSDKCQESSIVIHP